MAARSSPTITLTSVSSLAVRRREQSCRIRSSVSEGTILPRSQQCPWQAAGRATSCKVYGRRRGRCFNFTQCAREGQYSGYCTIKDINASDTAHTFWLSRARSTQTRPICNHLTRPLLRGGSAQNRAVPWGIAGVGDQFPWAGP